MYAEDVFISTRKGKIVDVSLDEIIEEEEEQKEIHVSKSSFIRIEKQAPFILIFLKQKEIYSIGFWLYLS